MGGFFITDDILIDGYARHLGIYAIGVYGVMRRHCGVDGRCFPSVALISDKLGISGRQVTRAIKSLESYGLVSITRQRGGNSRYFLNRSDKWRKIDYVERSARPKESDIDLVWPEDRVASAVFPDRALTCEWGHYFDGNACMDCGFLPSEDSFKREDGFVMTGVGRGYVS